VVSAFVVVLAAINVVMILVIVLVCGVVDVDIIIMLVDAIGIVVAVDVVVVVEVDWHIARAQVIFEILQGRPVTKSATLPFVALWLF